MSPRGLLTDWTIDGALGLALAIATVGLGVLYLAAAEIGARRDRRRRRWPRRRSASFIAGLTVLLVDLYSGIGSEADSHLSAHMVEHMVMWLVVAPLLAAGAPVRLAFFSLGRRGRRGLARALRSRLVVALTSPAGSVGAFSLVLLVSHVPAVYRLTLEDDLAHVVEHVLYLCTAVLIWAPLVGVDPLPHRHGRRAQICRMAACMVPMAAISVWLLLAAAPLYAPYRVDLGAAAALHDQRLTAVIMLVAGLPAFAAAALARGAAGRGRETRPSERQTLWRGAPLSEPGPPGSLR
jgi:cytochrome c oxidase assembly factor CtaG